MTGEGGAPGPREQLAGLVFALLLIDPDLVIAEANPASEDMLGRSAHRLVGSPLFDVVQVEDARIGLAHCVGGGSVCTVNLFEGVD